MICYADKFGYYKTKNKTTYSKYEAFENENPEWIFNDDIFSSIDWTKEPEISLWEMYKDRVKQIRDQYDYCVLWYSGGSDSHNILSAWLETGCKIDEIATTWNYDTTGEKQNHQNAEIVNVVLPDITSLRKKGYDFNFRLINIPDYGIKAFDKLKNNLEYYFNYNLQLSSLGKQFLRDEIEDYKNIINSGKKLCFIWGKEKPYIFYEEGKYCFRFADSIDDCVGPYTQQRYNQGWYDELFYWSPDYPLLPIKMAHVIKNFLKISENVSLFNKTPFINYSIGYSSKLDMYLKQEVQKKLLYPKWSNKIFTNGKSPTRILGLRDDWFINKQSKELLKIKDIIINFNNISYKKMDRTCLYPMYSKRYWLE
jgi:hypothetical protein